MKVFLVASDLSPRSDRAVAQAAPLAARMDARLVLRNLESTAAGLDALTRDRIAVRSWKACSRFR